MHRNTPQRRQWEIPGGKIEPNESAEQAALREIKEELGVEVKIIKHAGLKEFTEDNVRLNYSWYIARIISGQPKIMEPQTFDQMRFFTPKELQANWEDLSQSTQNYLRSRP